MYEEEVESGRVEDQVRSPDSHSEAGISEDHILENHLSGL